MHESNTVISKTKTNKNSIFAYSGIIDLEESSGNIFIRIKHETQETVTSAELNQYYKNLNDGITIAIHSFENCSKDNMDMYWDSDGQTRGISNARQILTDTIRIEWNHDSSQIDFYAGE